METVKQATAAIQGQAFADLVHQVNTGALATALEGDTEAKIFEAMVTLRNLIDQTICDACGSIIGICECEQIGEDIMDDE